MSEKNATAEFRPGRSLRRRSPSNRIRIPEYAAQNLRRVLSSRTAPRMTSVNRQTHAGHRPRKDLSHITQTCPLLSNASLRSPAQKVILILEIQIGSRSCWSPKCKSVRFTHSERMRASKSTSALGPEGAIRPTSLCGITTPTCITFRGESTDSLPTLNERKTPSMLNYIQSPFTDATNEHLVQRTLLPISPITAHAPSVTTVPTVTHLTTSAHT